MSGLDTRTTSLRRLGMKAITYLRLGPLNLVRVLFYRLGLRLGVHPVMRIGASLRGGDFFGAPKSGLGGDPGDIGQPLTPSQAWKEKGLYFGWHSVSLTDGVPRWHGNPFGKTDVPNPQRRWWQIPDFDPEVGDVKTIWEPSRFDWVLPMAQRARLDNHQELERLNTWLKDWCANNPPYKGPNWKCGQEASIRLLHLAVAARMLGQVQDTNSSLLALIKAHLKRIYPTISYAVAQDNNHGTSEAAALFIGGTWSGNNGVPDAARWQKAGRRLMENRVRRLFEHDGSFSQYSVNYHRLALDTLSLVELWRQWNHLDRFSDAFYERARAATKWLYDLVDPKTGDAPNLGANDGARLIPLTDADYRDYRPSVQLAMAVFFDKLAYASEGPHRDHLRWLDIGLPVEKAQKPRSKQRDHGGYSIMRQGPWFALFRYPAYRFRPGHCDALHLDLWYSSHNLLRDSGSFSYAAEPKWRDYFSGTRAHNTVEFDNRDQMPRVSRFLRGAWLKASGVEPVRESGSSVSAAAGYRDWLGAYHHRSISLTGSSVTIVDQVRGFQKRAVLRWRLAPGEWQIEGHQVVCDAYKIRVESDVPIVRIGLVEGWESRYYMKKTPLQVLEVKVHEPGNLTTHITGRG